MQRIVDHHGYVRRSFEEVCAVLETNPGDPLETATVAAAAVAAEVAPHVRRVAEFFDVDHEPKVRFSALQHQRDTASIAIDWQADPAKRLLPSVSARVDVSAIIADGPQALTELRLRGEYLPTTTRDLRAPEFFLQRRVVDMVLHTFLANLATALQSSPREAP